MQTPDGRTVFWHRRDLRTVDNVGLAHAAQAEDVVPIYVLDPSLIDLAGAPRTKFLLGSVSALQDTYRQYGSDLIVRMGDPDEVVPELCVEYEADTVVWNQDHSRFARERDRAITNSLEDLDIVVQETADLTLYEPGDILTTAGDHYSVFTYYHRKWMDRAVPQSAESISEKTLVDLTGPDVLEVADETPNLDTPLAWGREAAVDRLQEFLDGPIYRYEDRRDPPAMEGTSRLSQDLKFGLLGIREVMGETVAAAETAPDESAENSVAAFQEQLAWRDFYFQVLAANPDTVWENFQDFPNEIEWREDPAGFEAWKRGETGYPIVDAGMRQLRETAYMHNRVRMIVASFLTKDLQIDWRRGYRWFRKMLVDHETASDVGGWQWAASTGTDAQPYFRVFNPVTQGERYDPDAEYITRYIPELRETSPGVIHDWTELSSEKRNSAAPEYPDPIVDHGSRRESAIAMFEQARGDD